MKKLIVFAILALFACTPMCPPRCIFPNRLLIHPKIDHVKAK